MDDTIDTLQIKIDQAKAKLPEATLNAINAVDWHTAILKMRDKMGFTFEQLGDLETETELVLCGLMRPEDYPKELKNHMQISDAITNQLVQEMNLQIFSRIKEELIKNTERNKIFAKQVPVQMPVQNITDTSPDLKMLELAMGNEEKKPTSISLNIPIKENPIHPMFAQKLSGSVQTAPIKTEHTLENITKGVSVPAKPAPISYPPKADPYRLSPDE